MVSARLLACLLSFGALVAPAGARADEPGAGETRLRRALRSPATQVREQAVADVVAAGAVSIPRARVWTRCPDVRLREAGWAVLRILGRPEDLRAAIVALADPQPAAALAAAHAVVSLGSTLRPGSRPWIPRGSLSTRSARPLAFALASAIEGGPRDAPAPVVLRLGEGILPSLTRLLATPRVDTGVRAGALRALAAIGGDEARRAIAALVEELEETRRHPLWSAWWRGILDVGRGRGLAKAQDLAVRYAREGVIPARGPLRRLDWRSRLYYCRFLARCPPAEGVEYVHSYLEAEIERAASAPHRRFHATLAAPIIRAYLVVADPTDEMLRAAVLCAQGRRGRGARRRAEELGEVLALLAPYRDRAGVQEGLDELLGFRIHESLAGIVLPRTVLAWATYLQGGSPTKVRALAAGLMDQEDGAVTLAERRLGARLLGELGVPPEARIRGTLADLDPHLRMLALEWAVQGARAGSFLPADRDRALRAALLDPDDAVFLVAAERASADLGPSMRARLLHLGVAGPLTLRGRVWRVVERRLGARGGPAPAFAAPGGFAALDRRLRAAAEARAAWDL